MAVFTLKLLNVHKSFLWLWYPQARGAEKLRTKEKRLEKLEGMLNIVCKCLICFRFVVNITNKTPWSNFEFSMVASGVKLK